MLTGLNLLNNPFLYPSYKQNLSLPNVLTILSSTFYTSVAIKF